jgi:hypothetical protein
LNENLCLTSKNQQLDEKSVRGNRQKSITFRNGHFFLQGISAAAAALFVKL